MNLMWQRGGHKTIHNVMLSVAVHVATNTTVYTFDKSNSLRNTVMSFFCLISNNSNYCDDGCYQNNCC